MDFKASYRKLESVHTVTCPGGPRGTPHFLQLKSVLPNSSAVHDFASSGTDHIRVPSPLHTTGEKQPQLPLPLVPPLKELLNLIWKQLGGSS